MFLKKLFGFKKDTSQDAEDWHRTLIRIVDSDPYRNVQFPVLILSDHIIDGFRVFERPENLVDQSVFGHWGLDHAHSKSNELDEIVIDSDGDMFELDHQCYDKESEIAFSYPTLKKGTITLDALKKRLVNRIDEYIEIMDVKAVERCTEMKTTLQSLSSIRDVILYIGYTEF